MKDEKLVYASLAGNSLQLQLKAAARAEHDSSLKIKKIRGDLDHDREALSERLDWFYQKEKELREQHAQK